MNGWIIVIQAAAIVVGGFAAWRWYQSAAIYLPIAYHPIDSNDLRSEVQIGEFNALVNRLRQQSEISAKAAYLTGWTIFLQGLVWVFQMVDAMQHLLKISN